MARQSQPQEPVAPVEQEYEGPVRPAYAPLSLPERDELKAIFTQPVFRKAWSNAKLARPPALISSNLTNTEGGDRISAHQLMRQQGWEMFAAALFRQTDDPKPPRAPLEESFPPDPFLMQEAIPVLPATSAPPPSPTARKPRK